MSLNTIENTDSRNFKSLLSGSYYQGSRYSIHAAWVQRLSRKPSAEVRRTSDKNLYSSEDPKFCSALCKLLSIDWLGCRDLYFDFMSKGYNSFRKMLYSFGFYTGWLFLSLYLAVTSSIRFWFFSCSISPSWLNCIPPDISIPALNLIISASSILVL